MVNVKLYNVSLVGQSAVNHVVAEKLPVKFSVTATMSLKNDGVTNNRVQLKLKASRNALHVMMVNGFANRFRVRMVRHAK